VSRLPAAALAVLVSLSAFAAGAPKPKGKAAVAQTSGKIIQSQSKLAPGPDGPELREGRVTILDRADRTEEYKVTPRTRIKLDGKPGKFQKSSQIGTLVLKAVFNPATKELLSLDLKSLPRPRPEADEVQPAGLFQGEITNTDVIKGALSLRGADRSMRTYAVSETAKIRREAAGKPAEDVQLEALQVGDTAEVQSPDGRTAFEIRARAAR
jgi:hypothetical protein